MPVSLLQLPENYKVDYDHEYLIVCAHCGKPYVLQSNVTWRNLPCGKVIPYTQKLSYPLV